MRNGIKIFRHLWDCTRGKRFTIFINDRTWISYCLRPKAKDLGITRVVAVVIVLGFFIWSMPYQLPPPCYPPFFKYFKSIHPSIHPHIYLFINPSSSIFFCQSFNWPLLFPKYQYIIAADPGASIGLVYLGRAALPRRCFPTYHKS